MEVVSFVLQPPGRHWADEGHEFNGVGVQIGEGLCSWWVAAVGVPDREDYRLAVLYAIPE